MNDWDTAYINPNGLMFTNSKPRVMDKTKIDYVIKGHTNASQICEGVYPPDATRDDVEEKVKGTFGGRFEYFSDGRFKYIAYTD